MSLLRRLESGLAGVLTEAYKLGREMLIIPAQLWLLVAEVTGAAVLRVWLVALWPVLRTVSLLLVVAYRVAAGQLTPARAVTAVGLAAAVALVASQWLDYRSVSVGTGAYSGGVEAVAPAPDVSRDPAGDAHAWVMIPIAALGALGVALAYAGRARAAWLAVAAGIGAIAIAVGIDAPKGLDEGPAAITYEGAAAQLLEGFWAQIASGVALAGAGLLILAHGTRDTAAASSTAVSRRARRARAHRLERQTRVDIATDGPGA